MRVLIIGGTNFIGPPVIRYLHQAGHNVMIFHRGKTQADLPSSVAVLTGDRASLTEFRVQFEQWNPDVVLDMIPFTEDDARSVIHTFTGMAQRIVAISSQDVYRAYDVIRKLEPDVVGPVPIPETAPLRSRLYPFKDLPERPIGAPEDYEKILVEKVFMSQPNLPATILRLPMVYGARDPLHRVLGILQRMDERPAVVLEEGVAAWRGSYGYVENVAWAIALAVTNDRAAGGIYNVADLPTLSTEERVRAIAQAAGWQGKIVVVPRSQLPDSWNCLFNTQQNWVSDTTRIRKQLGYLEPVSLSEALRQTIAWERAHPPDQLSPWSAPELLDPETETTVLANLGLS